MGADAPIPPVAMNAAAVEDFLMETCSMALVRPNRRRPASLQIKKKHETGRLLALQALVLLFRKPEREP